MAGYADTKKLIEDSLVGRPEGTLIYPKEHQAFALQMLDYIRSVELMGASTLQGIATPATVPVQPNNGRVSYIATVPAGTTYTFTNFHQQNGNSITITSGPNTVSLVTLLWNGEYWTAQNNQVQLMLNIVDGYLYAGIALPETTPNPVTPDEPCYYIAATAGTYGNFGGIVVNAGEVAFLKWNGTGWTKEVTGLASSEEVSRLGQKVCATGIDAFQIPLGSYCIDANGNLVYVSSGRFSCTKLIPVNEGDVFVFTGYFSSSGVPLVAGFADEQRTGFVNLLAGGDYTEQKITIPDGVNYVQAWGENGYQFLFEKIGNKFDSSKNLKLVVDGNGGEDYTKILDAIIYANTIPFEQCEIRVKSGVYDIEQEYKERFGNAYFGNYAANYNGYVNGRVDAGLFLYPGMSLIGEGNVEIVFNYAGDNINVLTYFSPLNTTNNVRVENLTIRSSETPKCRYIIHDDFAQGAGTNVFKNLILRGGVHGGSIMGCGMGAANMYIIENCYLGNENHDTCVNYHNNGGDATAKNKLIVSNCKGEGNCIVQTIGPSTEKTPCIVNNCEFWRIMKIRASSDTYGNDNMELIEFNNVKIVE